MSSEASGEPGEQEEHFCYECQNEITDVIMVALGREYHKECFVCQFCKREIGNKAFKVHDDNPCHRRCYDEYFGKRCHACNKLVSGKFVTALGFDWHIEHFVCKDCKKRLANQKFMQHDGFPVCKPCYTKNYAEKCKRCKRPIMTKMLVALDGKWHVECFVCVKCLKPIGNESFHVTKNKLPLCLECANSATINL